MKTQHPYLTDEQVHELYQHESNLFKQIENNLDKLENNFSEIKSSMNNLNKLKIIDDLFGVDDNDYINMMYNYFNAIKVIAALIENPNNKKFLKFLNELRNFGKLND